MASIRSLTIPLDPSQVLLIGTGGGGVVRAEWVDGERTGESITRDGADLRRLSGISVSAAGIGLDGAVVETTTPLDEVGAGTVFAVSGTCELFVRSSSYVDFRGNSQSELVCTLYVQTLTPVLQVQDALQSRTPRRNAGGEAA